jgi:hypothetical protein
LIQHEGPKQNEQFVIVSSKNGKKNAPLNLISNDAVGKFYRDNAAAISVGNLSIFSLHSNKKKKPATEKNENVLRFPKWFDWKYYLDSHIDLTNAGISNQEDAYNHWIMHGESEGRECMKNHNLFKKYPSLFHKYLLGISNSEDPIKYDVLSESKIDKPYICCIHCYDLNKLSEYFDKYMNTLNDKFNFIITYVIDIHNIRYQYDFTFIQIENRGMDIGSKFITVDYLKKNNIDYKYLFFIHSKSNGAFREKYMQSFTNNLKSIISYMDSNAYYGIFNSLIHNYGEWRKNYIYMNEIIEYLNLDRHYFSFPEGNFYILHKYLSVLANDNIVLNLLFSFYH